MRGDVFQSEILKQLAIEADLYEQKIQSFEYVWEQDARWLSGRRILGDILRYIEGKSLVFTMEGSNGSIGIPLPTVKDEISGNQVGIYHAIPDTLKTIFAERYDRVISRHYQPYVNHIIDRNMGCRANGALIAQINYDLQKLEADEYSKTGLTLADNAATEFGMGGRLWRVLYQ